MKMKFLLAIVLVQSALLVASWFGPPRMAQAELPDPGRQRGEMVDELRSMNLKLDQILTVLRTGELQVRTIAPDEKK